MTDTKEKKRRMSENDDFSVHILLWLDAVTVLPPPTWKIILVPHTHTLSSMYLNEALLCLFVSTPINPALTAPQPHATHSQQLSLQDYWQYWCGAVSSLPRHRGKDHSHWLRSVSLFLPTSPSPVMRLTQAA